MRAATQRPAFLPNPLAALAVSFALGVVGARFVAPPVGLPLACGAACTLLAAYCFVRRREPAASLLVVLAFCNAGAALMVLEKGCYSARQRGLYSSRAWYGGSRSSQTRLSSRRW
ncbi:MAG TPA: hypothetical protein VD861_09955 [Pyrinomonadaceae bacterium]|nr:hypothetical protein [Pyrinomonadaceae bacterium]